MLPVVTIIGLQIGVLLSGAVLTETIFNLAGVGRSLYEAITGRDYVVIQGFTLVIAIIFLVVNLLVDVSYAFLDPRIRLSDDTSAQPAPRPTSVAIEPGRPSPRRRRRACGATRSATSCASARRVSG